MAIKQPHFQDESFIFFEHIIDLTNISPDLTTGKGRRITSNPEYADPIDVSPDDKWIVVQDTRESDRQSQLCVRHQLANVNGELDI